MLRGLVARDGGEVLPFEILPDRAARIGTDSAGTRTGKSRSQRAAGFRADSADAKRAGRLEPG